MIDINTNPSARELKWFGVSTAVFLTLLGAMAFSRGVAAVGQALWAAAVLTLAVYYLIPGLRRPLYLAWMYALFPIGFLISWVLMAAIYFVIVTPVGLVSRIVREDTMRRRPDANAPTYWRPRCRMLDLRRYYKQF